jgi:hypothetical protein
MLTLQILPPLPVHKPSYRSTRFTLPQYISNYRSRFSPSRIAFHHGCSIQGIVRDPPHLGALLRCHCCRNRRPLSSYLKLRQCPCWLPRRLYYSDRWHQHTVFYYTHATTEVLLLLLPHRCCHFHLLDGCFWPYG